MCFLSFSSHVPKVVRSLGELRKAPREKPVTAAARNVQKLCGLAEWLRNHLVGADGTCPDHRRTLRRPFSSSYRGTLRTPYSVRSTRTAVSSVCDTDEIRYLTPILGAERRCSRAVLSRSSRPPPPDVNVRVILLSQWLCCGREHLPRYAARHSTSVCGEVRWTQVCALICAPLCYLKSHGAPHGAGYRRSDR